MGDRNKRGTVVAAILLATGMLQTLGKQNDMELSEIKGLCPARDEEKNCSLVHCREFERITIGRRREEKNLLRGS